MGRVARQRSKPGCWIVGHPVFAGAVLGLVVNDRVLKERFPGLITGKLSDVAGVAVVAMLLIAVTRRPRLWYPLFPNPVVAESVLDRLINTAHHIAMNGRSYRPNKRPKPTQETGTD